MTEDKGAPIYQLCERKLNAAAVAAYHQHIGVFKQGHRMMVAVAGGIGYGTRRMSRVIPTIPLQSVRGEYMFEDEAKRDPDATDRAFLSAYLAGTLPRPLTLYGLHSCLGPVYFRPDLEEVINLLSVHIDEKSLAGKRLYVTTEPHPSDRGSECYDQTAGRHRGETLVYTVDLVQDQAPGGPVLS